MNEADWVRHADDIALARYSVICPLVSRVLAPAERLQVQAEILAAVHLFPDGKHRRVSRRCLGRWCDYYTQGYINQDGEVVSTPGIEALRPVKRSDRGEPRKLDEALVDRAIALRREEPSRNTSTLIELLQAEARREQKPVPVIVEATLAYHLRQRGATKKQLKREGRAFPRYERAHRNSTWQGDWTQGFVIDDPCSPNKPRLCHLHAFIDDHSRYVVHAEFYFRQNLPCLEDCFRKAIVHGGIPERVYWDNGAVYHSRQIRLIAARLNCDVIFATPYSPEGKGKIERWFRTVKDAFYPEAKRAGIGSLAELNEFFWGWLERRYQTREHSETQETPTARWESAASVVRYPDPAHLVDLFLWEGQRQVDKSGCLQVAGNTYPVAEHLVGQKVTVRFDPFDLCRIRLYENGQFSQVLEPQTLVSQTFRKATPRKKSQPASLDSASAYRDQVTEERRTRVRQTLRQAGVQGQSFISQAEFQAALQRALGARILSASEGKWIQDFYLRNAPLGAGLVRNTLHRAVECKGTARHIRYYLDAIQTARLEEKGA